jgi:hypothetical protein
LVGGMISVVATEINALRSSDGNADIEQCGVAVRLSGTKPQDVVPGVTVVGNGWFP